MIFPAQFLSDLPREHLFEIDTNIYETNAAQTIADLITPSAPTINVDEAPYLTELISNFKLSPTALNTYLECHYKFKLDNLYKIPKAKAPAMCFGTAVHFALENLYLRLNQTGKPTPKKEFLADFVSALKREVLSESEMKDRLAHGKKILSAYYDHYRDEFKPSLFTEKNFGHANPIYLDDIALSGKSDRIDLIDKKDLPANRRDKHVRFIDYKTGAPKTRGTLDKETDTSDGNYKRQLVFYNLLAELDPGFGHSVGETELEFIEPDKSGAFHRERFIITPDEIKALKQTIRDSMKNIRALNFERTPDTSVCSRCDFRPHCWPTGQPDQPPSS